MSSRITDDIELLCTHLNLTLGDTYPIEFLGRAEKMLRHDEPDDTPRILPILESTALKNSDYEILMPDDRKGGFGFVHVDGTIPISEFFEEDKADYNVNAAIIVTGKLDELPVQVGSASKVYSFRKFMDDTVKAMYSFKSANVLSVLDSDPAVFAPFTIDSTTLRYFYYPFFAFRININLEVGFKEPC